jgi:sucrose phosphorylase
MPEKENSKDYPFSKFHYLQPDYSKPVYNVPFELEQRIINKLNFLYGKDDAQWCYLELQRILKVYYAHKTPLMVKWEKSFQAQNRFTEKDVVLITYGDLVYSSDTKPLETLSELCHKYLTGAFNTLHILPFFPYSSDRGFAIMDFEEVDPHLGTWEDILKLKDDFRLMFDGVFNHVSSKSRWFQEFLNQNSQYTKFFTVCSTKEKISADHLNLIVRPRTSDVLTEFKTLEGSRLVWTTFSADQIDLNFKNPGVLLKIVEILLTYIRRGADIIRLDAVTYLWEELGTTCVHLKQSHATIKLLRDILDAVAPHVALVTETNVPHKDNIRYFGNGKDEAQMVYNFALPPLVLHAFQTGNSKYLTKWAIELKKVSDTATYFNFLDSHDGIGVLPVQNILPEKEIELMALRILEHGGFISYRNNCDGTKSPYEFNITWYSAVNREDSGEDRQLKLDRYIASRAIALVMMGVPGIYLHGLLGSKNDAEAVIEERQTRSINRTAISKKELILALQDHNSNIYCVASAIIQLLRIRIAEKCFHPNARQKVFDVSNKLFVLLRTAVDNEEAILTITNITANNQSVTINLDQFNLPVKQWVDILTKKRYKRSEGYLKLTLKPYEFSWLKTKL